MRKFKVGYKGGGEVTIKVPDNYTIGDFFKWAEGIGAYGVWEFDDSTWISKEGILYVAVVEENERKQLLNE